MSRIGKQPISLPAGVTATVNGQTVSVQGPKGSLELTLPRDLSAQVSEGQLLIETKKDNKTTNMMHGTFRSLAANNVQGVSAGWSKKLELVGTGYRAEVQGRDLVLTVGFSHPVKIQAPDGIDFKVEKTFITVDGPDRHMVGQIAANIRAVRPPEPYKGKGIVLDGEIIRRKAGKAAKTAGAAA